MTITQAIGAPRSAAVTGNSIHAMGRLVPVPAIRGRETETAILDKTLDQVESGHRAVALIEGEPGIGKTRLLDAALEDARQPGHAGGGGPGRGTGADPAVRRGGRRVRVRQVFT